MKDSTATVIAAVIGLVATISAAAISPRVATSSLQGDYDELYSKYTSLQGDYDELYSQHTSLQEQYDSLVENNSDTDPEQSPEQQDDNPEETGKDTPPRSNSVRLDSLTPINTNRYWKIDQEGCEDSLGSDYSDVKSYIVFAAGYAEFYINNQYSVISGNIAAHADMSDSASATVTFYGSTTSNDDDYEIIKSYSNITRKTEKFSTGNLDISKYKFLSIGISGGYYERVLLTDFTLS